MKKLVLSGLLLALSTSQVFANVYASGLTATPNAGGYTLAYRLNDAADNVTVKVKGPAPATTVIRTISLGAQTTGPQTVTWDGKRDDSSDAAAGSYSWEITAAQTVGADAFGQISDDSAIQNKFYGAYGVSVVTNQNSPYFGRIYVSNAIAGTTTVNGSRNTPDGIYVLSSDLADITGQGNTPYTGGVTWLQSSGTSANSPRRVRTSDDGMVYVSDWSDAHSGIWVMDPANPSANFSELFDNTIARASSGLRTNSASEQIHGSIIGLWITGSGSERKLFTQDEDITLPGIGSTGSGFQYNIGTAVSGWNTAPTVIYDDAANGNIQINFSGNLQVDPNGSGYFISQYRAAESTINPDLIHVTTAGTVDWKSSVNAAGKFAFLVNGAFAVSPDRTRIAAYFQASLTDRGVRVYDMNNWPDFGSGELYRTPPTNTFNAADVAFDAAGNVYMGSGSAEALKVWTPPGPNSFTTNAPAAQTMTVGSGVNDWLSY